MQTLATTTELDHVLGAPCVFVYKHSETCPISAMALREVERFVDAHADVPVYVLDVHAQRPLCRQVAERLGVRHESPQVILLREGEVAWHSSHYGVNARAMGEVVGGEEP